MNTRFKRAIISCLTTLTVILTFISPVFASDNAVVAVVASKSEIKQGETVTVSVKLSPSTKGVTSFQMLLKYDSSKFKLESWTKGSGYDDIKGNQNFTSSSAKIIGYNEDGNTKSAQIISTYTFTALKNASGKGTFSIAVERLSYLDDKGKIVDVSFSTSSANVSINAPVTTTTTTKATTTTKKTTTTTTTPKKTTTTTTTTPKKTTTTTTTPKKTTTTTTTPKKTTTTTTTVTVPTTTTTSVATTTTPATTTPTEITTPETTTTTVNNVVEIPQTLPKKHLFKYIYDSVDPFEETEKSNFIFDLKDYVDDFSKSYDISVFIEIDGTVNGAVCYNMNGYWNSNNFKSTDKISEWNVKGIKLEPSDTFIHIPVYFMSTGSTFTIGTIVVWDSETGEIVYNGLEENADNTEDNPSEDTTTTTTNKLDEITPETSVKPTTTTTPAYSSDYQPKPQLENKSPVWIIIFVPVVFAIAVIILIIILFKKAKDFRNDSDNDDDSDDDDYDDE